MKSVKGCFGNIIRIDPDRIESMLKSDSDFASTGTIVSVGPLVKGVHPGDRVAFRTWLRDERGMPGEEVYYITPDAILEIL